MKKSIGYGRGSVYTIILKALQSGDKYGYEICKEIEEKSKGVYILKQPSLYSGLKRLEAQKDVYSYWGDSDIGGRRHYYSLTEKGKERINRTNFSWEDARADVLGDLFELSEDEKVLKSIKSDIRNVTEEIKEINAINDQIDEQIKKNQTTNFTINQTNTATPNLQPKIERHLVNENQQDLFSLFMPEINSNLSSENVINTVNFNENDQILNKENDLVISSSNSQSILEENKKSYQEEFFNVNESFNVKEKQIFENQNQDKVDSQNQILETNKLLKTEASVINVQDYLNSRKVTTLFDEEIKKNSIKIDTSNIDEFSKNNSNIQNFNNDDEMEKQYQDFLKAFEVEEKKDDLQQNDVINESLSKQNNNLKNNENSDTQNFQYDKNTVTFYDMNDNSSYESTNSNKENIDNSVQNMVFNEEFELIENVNSNDIIQDNQINNINTQINSNSNIENINNNISNPDDLSKVKTYPVEVKQIFGDLIEDTPEISDQEIQNIRNSIISENSIKNDFSTNQTKEIFEDYNKTNFKASNDLPRVNISNNINLSLNKDDFKQETKVYKSPFKSYHDDEIENEDYYDKMYEKAYKDRFANNEKYRSLNYKNETKGIDTTLENFNISKDNYATPNNIPFDEKYQRNYIESNLNTEDYVVRRYNNKSVKNLASKYFNISKFNKFNCLIKILIMILTTFIVNVIAFKFALVTKLQQNILTAEYCIIVFYIISSLTYSLLHKNQRKINKGNIIQIIKILNNIIILTVEVLINIFVLKLSGNLLNNYASFIIPTIVLVLFSVFDLIMIKVKNYSFLYE